MQKQLLYPKIIPRLFSSIIDFMLMTFLFMPFSHLLTSILFVNMFKEYLIHNAIKITDASSITTVLMSEEFTNRYFGTSEMMLYIFINTAVPLFIITMYFCCFWHYMGSTPGKYILGIKIVKENDIKSSPTMGQSIIRAITSPIGFILIWFSLLSSRRQTLHDKISGTLIVKK